MLLSKGKDDRTLCGSSNPLLTLTPKKDQQSASHNHNFNVNPSNSTNSVLVELHTTADGNENHEESVSLISNSTLSSTDTDNSLTMPSKDGQISMSQSCADFELSSTAARLHTAAGNKSYDSSIELIDNNPNTGSDSSFECSFQCFMQKVHHNYNTR